MSSTTTIEYLKDVREKYKEAMANLLRETAELKGALDTLDETIEFLEKQPRPGRKCKGTRKKR